VWPYCGADGGCCCCCSCCDFCKFYCIGFATGILVLHFFVRFYFVVVCMGALVMNCVGVRILRFVVMQVLMCRVCCPGWVQYEML
jgi:hypothetical protein